MRLVTETGGSKCHRVNSEFWNSGSQSKLSEMNTGAPEKNQKILCTHQESEIGDPWFVYEP